MLRIYFHKFFYVVFWIWSATSNRNVLDPSRNYFIIFILHHDHPSAWSKFRRCQQYLLLLSKVQSQVQQKNCWLFRCIHCWIWKNQRGQFQLVLCINMDHLPSGLWKLYCLFTIETAAIFLGLQIMSDDNSSIFGNLVTFQHWSMGIE